MRTLPKRSEDVYPHHDLYSNTHHSFIHKSPNWKLQCASANEQINTRECHFAVKTGACNIGTAKIIMPRERCWTQKSPYCMISLTENADKSTVTQSDKVTLPHTQKNITGCLQGVGGNEWREGPQRDPGTLWEVMEMFCI